MNFELLQPWSTFVMKTTLPPLILEKMIRITDEIVERELWYWQSDTGSVMEDQFLIDFEILEQEEVMNYFLDACRTFVVEAFCQSHPLNKENALKEEWITYMTRFWVNSQKDNEYFPMHFHTNCDITSVIYLKIPEYFPSRKRDGNEEDGAITFTNNSSHDKTWSTPILQIQPQVGDFFLLPAELRHFVYPFRTADKRGERRSISFNAEFTSQRDLITQPTHKHVRKTQ